MTHLYTVQVWNARLNQWYDMVNRRNLTAAEHAVDVYRRDDAELGVTHEYRIVAE